MSRIIIKNLPKGVKEDKVKEKFGEKGVVTDCALKYTKDGVFRKFAFVGYKSEAEAKAAVSYFNNTFFNTCKLVVELANDFGDDKKPRAWSKYSRDSSAFVKMKDSLRTKAEIQQIQIDKKKAKEQAKEQEHNTKVESLLGDLKDDPKFHEFLEAHKNRGIKTTWSNDALPVGDATGNNKPNKDLKVKISSKKGAHDSGVHFEGDDDREDDDTESEDDEPKKTDMDVGDGTEEVQKIKNQNEPGEKKTAGSSKANVTDMDFLKSKIKKSMLESDSDSSDEDEGQSKKKEKKEKEKKKEKKSSKGKNAKQDVAKTKKCDDGSNSSGSDSEESSTEKSVKSNKKKNKKKTTPDKNEDIKEEEDDSGDEESGSSSSSSSSESDEAPKPADDTGPVTHVIKMKGVPSNVKEDQIREFFAPLNANTVKIPKNAKGKQSFSIATVDFASNSETEKAMQRNKNFIGAKKIYLYKVKSESVQHTAAPVVRRPWEEKTESKPEPGKDFEEDETIAESGRLFVRNLSYMVTEDEVEAVFSKFGPLTEVNVPVDSFTKKVKGFAFLTYMMPEHAVKAFTQLDGTAFQGRMLHILPGKVKVEEEITEGMSFKKQQEIKKRKAASSSHNWNSLFLGANAVADIMADKYGASKSEILDASGKASLGVRMALGETQIVAETRDFLIKNGVALDAFSQASANRSKTVMLVKNLPAGVSEQELSDVFAKHGSLGRVLLPPAGITAIIEYLEPSEARTGFRNLAYSKFQHVPLYLEWAPMDVFSQPMAVSETPTTTSPDTTNKQEPDEKMDVDSTVKEGDQPKPASDKKDNESDNKSSDEEEDIIEPESCLFVKNLNFETLESNLRNKFELYGEIRSVTIAKKKDVKNPGKFLSLGYGFVEFKLRASAQKALKKLQHAELDGHKLELKTSNRATLQQTGPSRKKQDSNQKQTGTKILVRNLPFEAKHSEVRELFSVFGELKTLRLPKKMSGTGSHRGFAFVDFLTKQDAKRAFNALCHSTHLYGRRLVLEWAEAEDSVEELRKKTAAHFYSDSGPSKKLKKSGLEEELKGGK